VTAAGAQPRPGRGARALLAGIGAYRRWVSPLLGSRCRFYPSCSAYAAEAVATHGALRGTWLALARLVKCGPWHPGGVDRVPPARPRRSDAIAGEHEARTSPSLTATADGLPGRGA